MDARARLECGRQAQAAFFTKVRTYCDLSPEAELAWSKIMRLRTLEKDASLLRPGDTPTHFAYVLSGLLFQHFTGDQGVTVIKHFFAEGRIAGSVPATLLGQASRFGITAIEDCVLLEYEFAQFRQLVSQFADISEFYIRYLERHWVVEKEPEEIAFRHDDAMARYRAFMDAQPGLHRRLKQHHIAAWLGITPESLSRLRRAIAYGSR